MNLCLDVFCPNLQFDNFSIDYINDEIQEPKVLLNCLHDLNEQVNQKNKLPCKKFKAVQDWLEINKHITNGSSAVVRVYYKKQNNIYYVHVSDKNYQKIVINKLKIWKKQTPNYNNIFSSN
ncbi:MAG: hypothetical protein Q9M50_09040 [Methylococcales bacterium]|nr:hypothetical protein [Methylococcales bacterium]